MTFEEFEQNLSELNKPMIDKIAEDIRAFIARSWNEDYCRDIGEIAPCIDAGRHPVNLYKNYKVPGSDSVTLTIKFGINEFDSFNNFFDIPMTDEDYDVDNQYNGVEFYDFTYTINNNIPELFFVPVQGTLTDTVEFGINGVISAPDASQEDFEKRLENFKSFLDGNLDEFIEKLNTRITHAMLVNMQAISVVRGIPISNDPDLDYDEDEGEAYYDIDEDDIGGTSGGYLS